MNFKLNVVTCSTPNFRYAPRDQWQPTIQGTSFDNVETGLAAFESAIQMSNVLKATFLFDDGQYFVLIGDYYYDSDRPEHDGTIRNLFRMLVEDSSFPKELKTAAINLRREQLLAKLNELEMFE